MDQDIFLAMLEDRNLTVDTYEESVAVKIYDNIEDYYIKEFKLLMDKIESNIK